jgi:hypothetical protein
VGDFNHDGSPDLAVANAGVNDVSVLLGNGSGGFGSVANFSVGLDPGSVAVGDFNHDGNLDLAVGNFVSGTVSVLLGNGSGGFSTPTNLSVGTFVAAVAIGDFNRDGNLDLAVTNGGINSSVVSVLLGNGNGGFGSATNFPLGSGGGSLAVGDLNHDGGLDLAVANISLNSVSVLLNQTPSPPRPSPPTTTPRCSANW